LIKRYYYLTKPGIIYGNLLAAIAGFFLASAWQSSVVLFIAMVVGLGLVIASGCVFNNVIDRNIDSKMDRTKKRAIVTGEVSKPVALLYGIFLGLLGVVILFLYTNLLTVMIAAIGWVFYVVVYGIAKRGTVHSTIIGSIAGSVPPVVGYVAVTGKIDIAAILLFLILASWQMPHFYAIGIYRLKDYVSAGIPVLPASYGINRARRDMILFTFLFIIFTSLLYLLGYTGIIYLVAMTTASIIWLSMGMERFKNKNPELWAKQMFRFSLIVLLVFCITISI
jgi:protoheme IX farnesyltransferase